MPLNTRRSTRTRASRSLLTLSLVSLSSAIVIPADPSVWGASSTRKSINYGPQVPSSSSSIVNPNPTLSLYNTQAKTISQAIISSCADDDYTTCLGNGIANEFLSVLHPGSSFKLSSGYLSSHNGIYHAHFIQLVNGIPVSNANININVDLASHQVVSYGDSSFSHAASIGSQVESWKEKVASWAGSAIAGGQVVLGGASSDSAADEFATPPLVPAGTVHDLSASTSYEQDPRHGLISFLALQSPSPALTQFLVNAPRQQLLDLLSLKPVEEKVTLQTVREIENVPTTLGPVKASLAYIHDGSSTPRLTWRYEVLTNDNQYEAYVDATPGSDDRDTLMVVDWVRDFRPTGGELGFESVELHKSVVNTHKRGRSGRKSPSWVETKLVNVGEVQEEEMEDFKSAKPSYKVFPWGVNAPDVGKRELLTGSLIELDNEASPVGWHTIPATFKGGKDVSFRDTRGNNVYAQDNKDGGNSMNGYRPSGGADMAFDFPLHWPKEGTPLDPATYINASVTELFYTNNEIHDLFYRYGFDEVSGNFQDYNFGRGGLGDDAVQANAQDGSGMNNANFATPPDGSRPRMRMYSWSGSQPYRDGDFEAGIVIHEGAHGISTRLTGGPANSGCLGWGEAGGMGEGWGDFFATMIRMHSVNETEFSMGEWASSRANGIRNYRYSRNMTVNPSTYKTLDKPGYWGVHAIGEVWAEILFETAELLIDEHGFEKTLFPPAANSSITDTGFYNDKYKLKVPKAGNTLALQLVVDGMKIQPCRPSFQDARDAIIQADKILTGGDNECILWKGFSTRGLGPDSQVIGSTPWGGGVRTDDYKVPSKCSKKKSATS
ncbi:extracellular elastinolytic metalloproteinase, partial [Phenoliferia sp. Uapishka_3]